MRPRVGFEYRAIVGGKAVGIKHALFQAAAPVEESVRAEHERLRLVNARLRIEGEHRIRPTPMRKTLASPPYLTRARLRINSNRDRQRCRLGHGGSWSSGMFSHHTGPRRSRN